MALGKAGRLEKRRKQGPSGAEQLRGPNTGAWEKLLSGWQNRGRWDKKTEISDPDRFHKSRTRGIQR